MGVLGRQIKIWVSNINTGLGVWSKFITMDNYGDRDEHYSPEEKAEDEECP